MADDLAPRYIVEVNDIEVGKSITDFITQVEYESADGLADVAKLTVMDPEFRISNAKVFQPGNQMNIWMGYGTGTLEHIGRVVLQRLRPNFPQNGMPTIEVQGYTLDAKMMDNSPEEGQKRQWAGEKYSAIVEAKALDYGMAPDVTETPQTAKLGLLQKPGVSDYKVVQGLANLTGYYFWVDADEKGKWSLHFKSPEDFMDSVNQPGYTFRYNYGDLTTLLSFRPDFVIKGATTKIKVQVKNTRTNKMMTVEIEEENDSIDVTYTGNDAEETETEVPAPTEVKVFLGDFSFTNIANKKFENEQDVEEWAKQWFKRLRENLILASGDVVGVEGLRARQVHTLEMYMKDGTLNKQFSGGYYFTRVRHVMSSSGGYVCDFNCRKQF